MARAAAQKGTVGKAFDVLDQVAAFARPVRFSELLAQSTFPKATLYRLVQTLNQQGMLRYEPADQTYMLGMRLVRLAHSAWNQASLAPIARPHLDQLSAALGETVHLAELDAAQVLYVDKRNARKPVAMYAQTGKVGPAYCTGVGKAMLAFLDEEALAKVLTQQSFHRFTETTLTSADALLEALTKIRESGCAFDREEHEPGIICVAAPILDDHQRPLGAVSVTGPTSRVSFDDLTSWAPLVRKTAEAIAGAMQGWRFPDLPPPDAASLDDRTGSQPAASTAIQHGQHPSRHPPSAQHQQEKEPA